LKHTVLSLESCKIPSINHKYLISKRTGKFILCRSYREIKRLLTDKCKAVKIAPPYRVEIYIETSCDIDNGLKVILDSLTNAIDDDDHILDLRIIKKKIKRARPGKLLVTVESIETPDYSPFKDLMDKIKSLVFSTDNPIN
jgi:Holliday junction resolvase RusA-like endonuclease